MSHMMKKADFLKLVGEMKHPRVFSNRGRVYLRDGLEDREVEIYCASNMEEAGLISSQNQTMKYRAWMN